VSCKHKRYFILTTFTLPHLHAFGVPAFLLAIRLEPYIRNFVRLNHSNHIVTPPALSRTTLASKYLSSAPLYLMSFLYRWTLVTFVPINYSDSNINSLLGYASHDFSERITFFNYILKTLFGVLAKSLQGVSPSIELSVI